MHIGRRAAVNTSLGVVVALAAVGAFFVLNPTASSTDSATRLTATVQQGTVSSTITASGNVAPVHEVSAYFAVSGTIATVAVKPGDTVAAGAVLGTLQTAPLQQTLNDADTAVSQAKTQLSGANAALAAAEAAPVAGTTQSAGAQSGGQPAGAVQRIQAINSASSQVASAQNQLAQANEAADQALADRDATTLTAPIAGLVVAVNGAVGQNASAGGNSGTSGASGSAAVASSGGANSGDSSSSSSGFATIADISAMTVSANIAEADIASMAIGQTAAVTFPAMSGVTAAATVTAIAPTGTASNSVVTFPTTVTLSTIPPGLRLGQSAQVAITTKSSAAHALYVPAAAITTTAAGDSSVKVVSSTGATSTVTVTLGVVGTVGTQIVSGLRAGETVVLGTVSPATTGTGTNGSNAGNTRGGFGGGGGLRGGGFGGGGGFDGNARQP
ncbi:MAG TPA: efflux RND transporter periplasmic adaptor subunit [Mycobacterium sp.]|nr:efflux RND transporter periplasmic adaptor subunit [Mycobacterium sp.]